MKFNRHDNLEGKHAVLSPSKYHWIDYSEDRLNTWLDNCKAMIDGVETHDFARRCIERGVKLPRKKKTLNMYVNDSINYGLTPEQVLYHSDYCFGTADAIGVKDDTLYIFDLKTGVGRSDFRQLCIYAALFCLEYQEEWANINHVVLHIYQMNSVREERHPKEEIVIIARKIIDAENVIIRRGGASGVCVQD